MPFTLAATLECRGMVTEADTFSRCWVANVDGWPAKIWEAFGFLRGVVVQAGTHRIEMRYRAEIGLLGRGACLLAGLRW